jgi:hypothetical protein
VPLHYLRYSEIDLAAWDACVAAALQVVPYAQAAWLRHTNGLWDAVVEVDGHTGQYRSLFPVPVQRRLWGREALQPPFTQQLGLLTSEASQHCTLNEYLALLPGRFARLHLQLNTDNAPPKTPPDGWQLTERQTYHLPLAADYETVHAGYCSDYRRRLRQYQAAPNDLMVEEAAELDWLVRLFQLEKGQTVRGMKPEYYKRLSRLYATMRAQRQTVFLVAYNLRTQETYGGALFMKYRNRWVYLFAAATAEGKKRNAPLILLDTAIRWHLGAGTPNLVLDFEGGMIPSIARFFANFGARPVPYYTLTQTTRPWYLTWMR